MRIATTLAAAALTMALPSTAIPRRASRQNLVDAGSSTPPADASLVATDAGAACVEVGIRLDLRALPSNTSAAGVDMFVLSQLDRFRRLAPRDAGIRALHWPGEGRLHLYFDGGAQPRALTQCRQTTTRYLDTAPRIPVIMQTAVTVSPHCRPCQ